MEAKRSYNNKYARTPGSKPAFASKRPRGLFENSQWYCDCQPRLPAVSFPVKKEGPNKGRTFYTCQQEKEQRCGFFIWGDEAMQREKSAVMNNSRSEPKLPEKVDNRAAYGQMMTPTTEKTLRYWDKEETESEQEPSPSRRKSTSGAVKRTAAMAFDEDEFDKDFPITEFEQQEFDGPLSHTLSPETPTKAQQASYPSPATTLKKRLLPWMKQEAEITPSKSRVDELMTPTKRQRLEGSSSPEKTTPQRPIEQSVQTPKASKRFTDALEDPDTSDSTLVKEIFDELTGIDIPAKAITNICKILTVHELRAKGVLNGRDMTRQALKKSKEDNAKLVQKIAGLETQLQLARAVKTANKAVQLRR